MFSNNNNNNHLIRDLHEVKVKRLHLMAPKDTTEKFVNKGKSKIGEALNNYNALREAIDNDIEYSVNIKNTKKKAAKTKFKIT
jgi:hypothetical protein